MYFAENNYTAYVQCPLSVFSEAFVIYTQGNSVISVYGIGFMAFFTAVEINISVFFIISAFYVPRNTETKPDITARSLIFTASYIVLTN